MARTRGLSPLVLAWVVAYACGSSLPVPATRPAPEGGQARFEVPFPPPAARVEVIPPKPEPGAVWLDGEWAWQGKRWVWETGGWIMAPNHVYFSPWSTRRDPSGKLFFAPGAWFDEKGKPAPKPLLLVPAQSSLGDEGSSEPAASSAAPAPPSSAR